MPACMFRISLRPFVIWVPCKNDARFERGRCAQAGILPYSISRLRIGGISQRLRVGKSSVRDLVDSEAWIISWSFSRDRFFPLETWLYEVWVTYPLANGRWFLVFDLVSLCRDGVRLPAICCTTDFALQLAKVLMNSCFTTSQTRSDIREKSRDCVQYGAGIEKEAACDPCREIL